MEYKNLDKLNVKVVRMFTYNVTYGACDLVIFVRNFLWLIYKTQICRIILSLS